MKTVKQVNPVTIHKANIPRSNTMPILQNVISKNGYMISSDLECTFFTKTDKKEGLYRIMGREFVESNDDIKFFPQIPFNESAGVTIKADGELLEQIIKTSGFCSREINRPIYTGIHFKVTPGKVRLAATNGKVIYQRTMSVETSGVNAGEVREFIVVPKPFNLISRDKSFTDLEITFEENRVKISNGNSYALCGLIPGKYPDYLKALPSEMTKLVTIDRKEWISILQKIKPYVKYNCDHKTECISRNGTYMLRGADYENKLLCEVAFSNKIKQVYPRSSRNKEDFVLFMPLRKLGGSAGSKNEFWFNFNLMRMLPVMKTLSTDKLLIGYTNDHTGLIITEIKSRRK